MVAFIPPGKPCPHGHDNGRDRFGRCVVCHRLRANAWYAKHPGPQRERSKRWRHANPEQVRKNNRTVARSKSTGLTAAQRDEKLAAQGGGCALCGTKDPGHAWHGDHDHVTGTFRAVLCPKCNTGLGMFRDDPNLCRAAADYLERHSLF